jgi:polar amino acid transport system ATP-binding protein
MTAAIEVRNLHKYFGENEVLKGIDFTVDQGQVVCVIGPSGSGKSTLLRCVNRLEEPTSGQIFVEGEDITDPEVDLNNVRSRIGMVFQQFNLFPHLCVLDNLTLAQRRVLKRDKAEAAKVARPTWRRSVSPTARAPTRLTSPAVSSSASPSRAPCRWTRT